MRLGHEQRLRRRSVLVNPAVRPHDDVHSVGRRLIASDVAAGFLSDAGGGLGLNGQPNSGLFVPLAGRQVAS
jgi:hypothetical protein